MGNKNVTVIPPKPQGFMQGLPGITKRRKVAGVIATIKVDQSAHEKVYH